VVPPQPATPTQGDRLLPGQGLMADRSIVSADGQFTFVVQDDGNLVLYGPPPCSQTLWASNTQNNLDIWDAVMQDDGNFVVYDAHSHSLWASNTSGTQGAWLQVQNDANVVIYDTQNQPLWSTATVLPPQPSPPTQTDRLTAGQGLIGGQSIISADGRFTFILQTDANLVLYGPGSKALWASNTNTHRVYPWFVAMQGDGNLVIYDSEGNSYWASDTAGNPGAWAVAQSDGNVVIYNAGGHPIWATNTVQ